MTTTAIAIALGIIIAGAGLFWFLQNKQNKTQVAETASGGTSDTSASMESNTGFGAPELFPEAEWSKKPEYAIYKAVLSSTNPAISYSYSVDVEGKMWVAEKKNIKTKEELNTLGFAFEKYYNTKLPEMGWRDRLTIDGREYKLVGLDRGLEGGVWGYVKLEQGKFSAISLEENITNLKNLCPCDFKMTVFVGDPMPEEDAFWKHW